MTALDGLRPGRRRGSTKAVPWSTRDTLVTLAWVVPFAFYIPLSLGLAQYFIQLGNPPGYDAWLYREAARAALSGGDPWSVGAPNAHFPGAPSTIVAFVPAVVVPEVAWQWGFVLACAIAGAVLVRRVHLPLVWLTYPPLFTGILLGQPGVLVGCLLVTRLAVLAPVVKPWAGIVLLFRPRWAVVAAAIGLVTIAIAPGLWQEWFRRLPELSERLRVELHGGIPVWANVVGALALVVIWRRRRGEAAWLAVSAVWPYPEYHNAILAVPTHQPLLLAGLALVPGPPVIVAYGVWLLLEPLLRRRRWPWSAPAGSGQLDEAGGSATPSDAVRSSSDRGSDRLAGWGLVNDHSGEPMPGARPPLVAVVIPALNEAGKIGRVLDKFPRDGRFEAIVVDDGSTDGTGDEARTHGADLVIRHDRRGGVGDAIRDGWKAARQRGRPYVALLSGDDQHEPAELIAAFDALLASGADYLQGSRWMPGGRVVGSTGGRGIGTRVYSVAFSILAGRRITDATNGFRIFRTSILDHPSMDIDQAWLDSYDLEPYVLFKAIRARYRMIQHPCTVIYHEKEGYTKMRGIKDWWRLFRPALLLRTGVKR